MYVAAGMGEVVLAAAGTMPAITLAAGAIGYSTRRDLTVFLDIVKLFPSLVRLFSSDRR